MGAVAWIVGLLLAVITLRRLRFVSAPRRTQPAKQRRAEPPVSVLIAARNEQGRIGDLLEALDYLDYPRERLRIVFVDDGSEDRTGAILSEWCAGRPHARAVSFDRHLGKAAALNRVLATDATELIVSFDADQCPAPDSVRLLVAAAEADDRVGAVSGFREPILEQPSFAAYYAALESWVHQLVVQEGKDRLGADPTSSGGGALYRRSALREAGWFPKGSLSEDVEVTLAMASKGWKTRFVREAVIRTYVASTLPALRRQRARWTVGLYRSTTKGRGLEARLTSLGYADRLAFLAAVAVVAFGAAPWWLPGIYLLGPTAAVLTALSRAQAGLRSLAAVGAALVMFPLDVAWTLGTSLQSLLHRDLNTYLERGWRSSPPVLRGGQDRAPSAQTPAAQGTGERAA